MRKYTNAEKQNIIDALKTIVDKRVKFWQEDFDKDRELIQTKENALPMIFIARECGTVLISVYLMLPEGASVCSNAIGTPCIDYMGFYQFGVLNQYDAQGCRPYIIDNDRRRAYLEVVEP